MFAHWVIVQRSLGSYIVFNLIQKNIRNVNKLCVLGVNNIFYQDQKVYLFMVLQRLLIKIPSSKTVDYLVNSSQTDLLHYMGYNSICIFKWVLRFPGFPCNIRAQWGVLRCFNLFHLCRQFSIYSLVKLQIWSLGHRVR